MLRRATERFGLTSVEHAYATTERHGDRLCIIDEELTKLLWQRLEPIHPQLTWPNSTDSEQRQTASWTALRLNECCRLSRYCAPSIGFKPHFDSPFVPSFQERSALSVVLYLADVGSTDFYFPPHDSAAADVLGLTTAEEVAVRGGLDRYVKCTTQAKRGRCLIFPHGVLHAGAPVEAGIKWILRTDVVFSSTSEAPFMSGGAQHSVAVEWFREAQNHELDGNLSRASQLYQRTLSLRRHAQPTTATATIDTTSARRPVAVWNASMWSMILFFLDVNDLSFVAACSKTFQAWCQRNRAIHDALWHKRHPQHRSLCETIDAVRSAERGHGYFATSEPRLQRRIEAYMPDYLPRFQSRHGSLSKFAYSKAVFDSSPAACLRALAMAAVYQFGVSNKSHTYVAQYDAERNRALACSARELLDAAFYERPLAGAWYHVHYANDAKVTQREHVPTLAAVKPSPQQALTMSVDPRLLRSPAAGESEARQQQLAGFEAHLDEGGDQYVAAVEQSNEHLTGYTFVYQEVTSLYKYSKCHHNPSGQRPGRCRHDDEWGSVHKPMYYNNLICDFSRARLEVEEVDDSSWQCDCCQELVQPQARRFWCAQLAPLSIASFQHAACQWSKGTKQPGTQSYKRSFAAQQALHHMHLFQLDEAEEFDPEQSESGSEVYDDNELSYELGEEPRQRAEVQLDSMLAPPAVDADYIFVSQYAAIHAM